MSMDGIGSAMSVQAQTQMTQKAIVQPVKPAAESMDATINTVHKTDIHIVENTQESVNPGNETGVRETKQPSNEQIRKAVEALNKKMSNSEAVFGIHDATNRVIIKIVDKESREVIKELPPEKTLDMIVKVWELAGILVDEKR